MSGVLLRTQLPLIYANPIWALVALEDPTSWIEAYRSRLNYQWLRWAGHSIPWQDRVRLGLQMARHGLPWVPAQDHAHLEEVATHVEAMVKRDNADFLWLESARLEFRSTRQKRTMAALQAADAFFFVHQLERCADSVQNGIANENPSSTSEVLAEGHWQANLVRAYLGYSTDNETVGGVRDNWILKSKQGTHQ